MTTKAEFNAEEWEQIAGGPALAGMIVISAQRGGTIRETVAMAKVYKETARTRGQREQEDVGERVIHVSSGGDGPRVEMSTGGSMFNPEASASPDEPQK